ncbi:MAG: hypothetical protein JW715_04145 [Sedimentisphaerales bacterium]|nr:hypothetical protein [Sedimentisphaerales bacterium]
METKTILFRCVFTLLFLPAVFCPASTGKIIYVDDDGPADFNNIQAAIDDANDGDTVLVAAGTYTGDGNRDIDFAGKAITVKSEDGPETCIIDCNGTEQEPHRGFYFHSGEDANSIVEGFTITGGYVRRYELNGRTLSENGIPKINDFIITENQLYSGGAIAAINCSIRIFDCIIKGNIATEGGGIFCENGGPVIEQCLIEQNQADFGGGMVCSSTDGDILVLNCLIKANSAESAGGGLICGDGTNVSGCLIVGNSAEGQTDYYNSTWPSRALKGGGGVALYGTGAILNNCTISENKADTGSGILTGCRFDYLDWAFIYNSIIFNNTGGDENQVVISPCCPMCVRIIAPVGIQVYYCCIQGTPTIPNQWPYPMYDSCAEYINCIDVDPLFAAPGYWVDVNDPIIIVEPNDPNAVWIEGDYHLKSQAGRYDPASETWVIDDVTSSCIDAGDPNSPVGDEPQPNGGIINMGAYGGTSQASKSYYGEPLCGTPINRDINSKM